MYLQKERQCGFLYFFVIFSPPLFSNSTKPIPIPLLPALSTYFSVSSLFVGIPAAFYVHNFQDYICECVLVCVFVISFTNTIKYYALCEITSEGLRGFACSLFAIIVLFLLLWGSKIRWLLLLLVKKICRRNK